MTRNGQISRHFCASAALWLLAITTPAFGLDELFETYNAPSALAMGNAYTADAAGANALFYNPAGLARAEARSWAITPLALDGLLSTGYLGTAMSAKAMWLDRLFDRMQASAGSYNYFRGNAMASVTRRGFGLALLGTYEYGAVSDGSNIDINFHKDLGVVIGGATNLFANMIKLGVSVKAINRNEMRGTYAHSDLQGPEPTKNLMKEGTGFGADFGAVFTLPTSYLPTLGFAWKDILGTNFLPTSIVNPLSVGVPVAIAQSMNLGFSIHPVIWKGARGTISAEIRHLERVDLPLTKKLHFGFQFMTQKRLFFWAGLNQMYPTGGIGLRLRGGDFEIGTYAQDIGAGAVAAADRRFTIRYTIGF